MLVLSRRVGQRIYVGDDICVTVVRISPTEVRIGIEAPRDAPIVRKELLDAASIQKASPAPVFDPTAKKPK